MAKKKKKTSKRKNSPKKKKTRVYCSVVDDMSKFYKVINNVQIKKKSVMCRIRDKTRSLIYENILKDACLTFDKKNDKNSYIFTIYPNDNQTIVDIKVEELRDEFLEDGQLF
ncbi:MAG: hypothetical protein ACOC5T_06460 [Elusimicrobiota bacterium]